MARVKVDAHKCQDCEGLVMVKIGDKYQMVLDVAEAVSLMQGLGSQLGIPEGSNGKAQHIRRLEEESRGRSGGPHGVD